MNKYLRLIRFDKPIGTLLLLWPTLWALLIAYAGKVNIKIYLVFLIGVFLTRSAGCAINDLADKDFDGKVERTKFRPLASGELTTKDALWVTIILSLAALIMAILFLRLDTLLWTLPAFILFVSYPFFKRFFPLPQLYLAIAFSIGILMVFIEATQELNWVASLLFISNLLWVLAYDTIYALVDIDDDRKIGIKTSAITFGAQVIFVIGVCYLLFLALLIILGVILQFTLIYWLNIVVVGFVCCKILWLIKDKERTLCFKAFLLNNYVGLFVALGIGCNYWQKYLI